MEIELEGKKAKVDIIGGFNFEEKDYAVCTYQDEADNNMLIVLLTEAIGEDIIVKPIPDEDVEKVTECFNKIKKEMLEEE